MFKHLKLVVCIAVFLNLSKVGLEAKITYDEDKNIITLTGDTYHLADIAKSIKDTFVFSWNREKEEATSTAHLVITDGAKLVIGKEEGENYPWDKTWRPQETLIMRSFSADAPCRLEVTPTGDIDVLNGRITAYEEFSLFKTDINGIIIIEKSIIEHGKLFINREIGSRGVTRGIIRDCLFNDSLTIRSQHVKVNNCRFPEVVLWNASGPVSNCKGDVILSYIGSGVTLQNCKGQKFTVSTCSKAVLINSHYDEIIHRYSSSRTKYAKEKLRWSNQFTLIGKRELTVKVIDKNEEPLENAVIKIIGFGGKEEYEVKSKPTGIDGKCIILSTEYIMYKTIDAKQTDSIEKIKFKNSLFIDDDGKGPNPFVMVSKNISFPENNVLTIKKTDNGFVLMKQ